MIDESPCSCPPWPFSSSHFLLSVAAFVGLSCWTYYAVGWPLSMGCNPTLYGAQNGAHVRDLSMSLIHICELNGVKGCHTYWVLKVGPSPPKNPPPNNQQLFSCQYASWTRARSHRNAVPGNYGATTFTANPTEVGSPVPGVAFIAVFISSSFRRHQHGPYSRAAAGSMVVVAVCSGPTWAAARNDDFATASAAATLARLSNSGRAI